MTQDFRQPATPPAQPGAMPAADMSAPQRLVIASLQTAAVLAILVGGWFWLSPPASLVAEEAPILAMAFMASGVVDFGLAVFLGNYWRKTR